MDFDDINGVRIARHRGDQPSNFSLPIEVVLDLTDVLLKAADHISGSLGQSFKMFLDPLGKPAVFVVHLRVFREVLATMRIRLFPFKLRYRALAQEQVPLGHGHDLLF